MHLYLDRLRDTLTDSRFVANLTVTYGTVVAMVLVSLVVRRLLGHGGERLGHWTGLNWLDPFGREAAQRSRQLIARLTWLGAALLSAAGIAYHAAGRDVRADFATWRATLTADDWLRL